jgi:DNA-damage-inducible protein J
MKEGVVRARIDHGLKAQASEVLSSCGLEISDAIRLFLRQVVLRGGLPFPIRNQGGVRVVAPGRLRAMKRAAQARDRAIAAHEDLSDGRMLLIRPDQVRDAKVKWPSVDLRD